MSIEFENFISNWKKGKGGRGKEERKEKVNPACLA
jgi:hypothetical protein